MSIVELRGVVKANAWGSPTAIPEILGVEPTGAPVAELWLGAHPQGSATADGVPLVDLIEADPVAMLGADVVARFGRLPFLPKLLAAAEPLSIQTHPDLETARAGFARENAEGIALDAFERTYRDDNHKPELLCALTPFDALCGFRPLSATRTIFDELGGDGLAVVRRWLDEALEPGEVMAKVLAAPPQAVEAMIADMLAGIERLQPTKEAQWAPGIAEAYPGDPGVIVALLLNHLTLQPGQAIFLAAGNVHAYLRGTGIEVMANSDNVIRGGLTPKYVDIDELVRVVDPRSLTIDILTGDDGTYPVPVPEFSLRRVGAGESTTVAGPAVVIAAAGAARVAGVDLAQGGAAFVPAADGAVTVVSHGNTFVVAVGSARD